NFSSSRLSLLDRGVSVALAHVRGGGEGGKRWHDAGRMLAKPNTFTDFVAAADHLVAQGYTARDRLVIEGGSAGGLLIGAVLNRRPDLCAAAVLRVPFVDVINTMLDESLPLTVGEFEECGDAKDRAYYDAMNTSDPYAGKCALDFLKLTTDDGVVGWSEYNETFGGVGVSAAIDGLAPLVVGKDPRAREAIVTTLYAVRRQAPGGVIQQAIAAIENALLDVQARALGVPVYELLGGPQRERLRLYWSHCGYFRLFASQPMQIPPIRSLADVVAQGQEGVAKG